MKKKDCYVIGITGGSGSGKSYFAKQVISKFSSKIITFVSQDMYYVPREEQLLDENGKRNFDLPSSIDHEAFAEDLVSLISGIPVDKKEYTFNNEHRESRMIHYEPAQIILVEGLFIYHFEHIRKWIDWKLFIHAHDVVKMSRRIMRDQVERNYPMDDVLYRYVHHVAPAYKAFIEPHKETADIVINNDTSIDSGLFVVRALIEKLLSEGASNAR